MAKSYEDILTIGVIPVYRGIYNGSADYYVSNMVTMYGSVFILISDVVKGVPPLKVADDGSVSMVNTTTWRCMVDNVDWYNKMLVQAKNVNAAVDLVNDIAKHVDETISNHINDHTNPHQVEKGQLGYDQNNIKVTPKYDAATRKVVIDIVDGFGLSPVSGNSLEVEIPEVDKSKQQSGLMKSGDKEKLDRLTFEGDTKIISADNLPSYVDDVVEGYLNDGTFYEKREETESGTTWSEAKSNGFSSDEDGSDISTSKSKENAATGLDVTYAYSAPIIGETGKIYVDLGDSDNKIYRYASGKYILISDVPQATLGRLDELEKTISDDTINKLAEQYLD